MADNTRATAGGELYDPFVHTMHPDPFPLYRELRDHHPVYWNETRGFFALSRFADVQAAARDWGTFSNSASVDLDDMGTLVGAGNFLDMDPPDHDRLRKCVRQHFTPSGVAELEEFVRSEAIELIEALPRDEVVDLAEALAWPLPVNVISSILGLPREDWDDVERALALFSLRDVERHEGDAALPPEAVAAGAELRAYLAELLKSAASQGGQGIVGDLARQTAEGLPVEEAAGICFLLYLAGTDTTSSLIGNAVAVLDRHPDQRERFQRGKAEAQAAVEELVRFEPPIQVTARITMSDAQVEDTQIPAGSRVVLLWGAAARDERRFPDPDVLDLARKAERHLGFGEGIHHCLGAPLARLEARVILEELYRIAPDHAVAGDPQWLSSHTTRGLTKLPVTLAPNDH